MKVYYENDADLSLIQKKKVAVIGYGSQGHAHALNLRESGVKDLVVGLQNSSNSKPKAEAEGLKVVTPTEVSVDEATGELKSANRRAELEPGNRAKN